MSLCNIVEHCCTIAVGPDVSLPVVEATWTEFSSLHLSCIFRELLPNKSCLGETRSQLVIPDPLTQSDSNVCFLAKNSNVSKISREKAWQELGRNDLKHQRVGGICRCVFQSQLCLFNYFCLFICLFFSKINSEERHPRRGWRWVRSSHPEGLGGSAGDSPGVAWLGETAERRKAVGCFAAFLSQTTHLLFCSILFFLEQTYCFSCF